MTQREKNQIDKVLEIQEQVLEEIGQVKNDMRSIALAVYGDKRNHIKGLLDRQEEDEIVHEDILKQIRPIVAVHTFVWSRKFVIGLLIGLGSVTAGIIYILQHLK